MHRSQGDLLGTSQGAPLHELFVGLGFAVAAVVFWLQVRHHRVRAARLGGVAGVPLHPSMVYEVVFHAVAFAVLWWGLRDRLARPAETFVLYIAAYGLFRFLVEFVRGNEVVWAGLTAPSSSWP